MRTRDREPGSSGPLKYAPKLARMAALEIARRGDRPDSEPRLAYTGLPERRPVPPRHCEPARPQKLTKQMGSFEGDVAVKDLRERMALGPDLPLEPPVHNDGSSAFGMVGRLVGLVAMAAIAAGGFVWTSTPQPVNSGFALAAYEKPAAAFGFNAPSSNNGSFKPAVFQSPPVQAAGLEVDIMRSRDETPPADRPQVLAPVPRPAPDGGRDLANTPRETQTSDVARSVVSALADTSLRGSPAAESQTDPPVSTAPRINDEEMANLLASGRAFLIIGDVTAARLAFRRAAQSGNAQAALALGGTFDPLVRAWVPSGSRPILPRRAAGTKRRRSSGRGMRRSGSIRSPSRRVDARSTGMVARPLSPRRDQSPQVSELLRTGRL
jgi:hypothetical protein